MSLSYSVAVTRLVTAIYHEHPIKVRQDLAMLHKNIEANVHEGIVDEVQAIESLVPQLAEFYGGVTAVITGMTRLVA